jgi:hypothetical protein
MFERGSIAKLAAEVALIAVGVFLGLAADQWRERQSRAELAHATLVRFRDEVARNLKAVSAVSDYHAKIQKQVRTYYSVPARDRDKVEINVQGLQGARFEQAAWDMALATEALAELDGELAFTLSHVYRAQQAYDDLSARMLQALYIVPWRTDSQLFLNAADSYFADVVDIETDLLKRYAELLPQLDAALAR